MEMKVELETYPMLIGDQLVPGSSGEFIEVINPSTEEVVGVCAGRQPGGDRPGGPDRL